MKKLLVLMLVLGMVSAAQALTIDLTLSTTDEHLLVPVGTVITVSFTASDKVTNIPKIDFTANGTNDNAIAGMGWLVGNAAVSLNGTETGSDILGAKLAQALGEQYVAGTVLYQFQVTINEGGDIGMANIQVQNPYVAMPPTWYTIGTLNTLPVSVIPEPMTIALLGLGGLFLRRRK